MKPHADILDSPEPLGRWLIGSVVFHLSVVAAFFGLHWAGEHNKIRIGDVNGGGIGSVAVNVVKTIPIPVRSGPVNPVANDTQSRVPTPPPKTKPKPEVKTPEPDAIPIKSRNAPKQPSRAAAEPNKFREKQVDPENQLYSTKGQAVVSPMYGLTGGGGVTLGNSSPLGQQFGYYANLLKEKVARNWHTNDIDPRIRTTPQAVVTFTIQRDGSVAPGSVKIAQRSGNSALDFSAQRAILDSTPFPPLPAGWSGNTADVEFFFELRR
jgi:protein TonB